MSLRSRSKPVSREIQQWLTLIVVVIVACWLVYRFYQGRRRAGLPVGPPVLVTEDDVLPLDDLHATITVELHQPIVPRTVVPEPAAVVSLDAVPRDASEPPLPVGPIIVEIEVDPSAGSSLSAPTPMAPEQRS